MFVDWWHLDVTSTVQPLTTNCWQLWEKSIWYYNKYNVLFCFVFTLQVTELSQLHFVQRSIQKWDWYFQHTDINVLVQIAHLKNGKLYFTHTFNQHCIHIIVNSKSVWPLERLASFYKINVHNCTFRVVTKPVDAGRQ